MPCYHCGTRQVDPDRGPSPWGRGLLHDHQILVCPGCQTQRDWTAELDRCGRCRSAHLVRRLGEVECRNCGSVRQPASSSLPGHLARPAGGSTRDPAEVERALAKVLGKTAKVVAAP